VHIRLQKKGDDRPQKEKKVLCRAYFDRSMYRE
jgi:hypothetical protein